MIVTEAKTERHITRTVEGIAHICGCPCHSPDMMMLHFAPCCGSYLQKLAPYHSCPFCGETFQTGDAGVDVCFGSGGGYERYVAHHKTCWDGRNAIRAELIRKKVESGLSEAEEKRLEALQFAVRQDVTERIPPPFSILEEK